MKRILEQCPNCKADLSESLFKYFHSGGDYSMNFEYQCSCGAILDVEVEVIPRFLCALAERPNTASSATAPSASVGGDAGDTQARRLMPNG